MKRSELNHLRRLVGWVRCEIGQSPAELVETMRDVADTLGHPPITDAARQRLVQAHDRAAAVPKYVRAAVKALEVYLSLRGEVVDVRARAQRQIPRSKP